MRRLAAWLILLALLAGCGPDYDRLGARRTEGAVEVLLALCEGEAVTGVTVLALEEEGEEQPIWRIEAEQPNPATEPSTFPLTLFQTPAGYTEVQAWEQTAFHSLAVDFSLEDHSTSISFELAELAEDTYYIDALNPEVPRERILDGRDEFCGQG